MAAESPLERLKRIAAEKKLAAASAGSVVEVAISTEEVKDASTTVVSSGIVISTVSASGLVSNNPQESVDRSEAGSDKGESSLANVGGILDSAAPASNLIPATTDVPTRTPSDHPLAMQFAELETALLVRDPEFKVILRSIHRQLGTEPELVTMMTEEEIGLIVGGLVVFANAEIVEPAKAKTVKAAVAATKKKVISVDDL